MYFFAASEVAEAIREKNVSMFKYQYVNQSLLRFFDSHIGLSSRAETISQVLDKYFCCRVVV